MSDLKPNDQIKTHLALRMSVDGCHGQLVVRTHSNRGLLPALIASGCGVLAGVAGYAFGAWAVAGCVFMGILLAVMNSLKQETLHHANFSITRTHLEVHTESNNVKWLWSEVSHIDLYTTGPELVVTHQSGRKLRLMVAHSFGSWLNKMHAAEWLQATMKARWHDLGPTEAIPDEIQAMRKKPATPSAH